MELAAAGRAQLMEHLGRHAKMVGYGTGCGQEGVLGKQHRLHKGCRFKGCGRYKKRMTQAVSVQLGFGTYQAFQPTFPKGPATCP